MQSFFKGDGMDANYQDGIIRDGSNIGYGDVLGNIKDGIIRRCNLAAVGHGDAVGNVTEGIIRSGNLTSVGHGDAVGNVKDSIVRRGNLTTAGHGDQIGTVNDFAIKGMAREKDEEMVATYHFLVKKIF